MISMEEGSELTEGKVPEEDEEEGEGEGGGELVEQMIAVGCEVVRYCGVVAELG
jgi:hypothetical protein